jgi:hypothetical protein
MPDIRNGFPKKPPDRELFLYLDFIAIVARKQSEFIILGRG